MGKAVAEGGYFVTMLLFTKLGVSVVGLKAIYEWLMNIVKHGFSNIFACVPVIKLINFEVR